VGRARRIPDDIVGDPELQAAIAQLPSNYNFEVHKTVWRAREVSGCVGGWGCMV
jgi:2-(3-amino-3-carboxypropyl)histidine synthase